MQKEQIKAEHIDRLVDYYLDDIDLRDALLLRFRPGETILREGMPMGYLLFVIAGKAKVCSGTTDGKDLMLCYYISRGIIGDIELMTGTHIAATTMIAITEFLCIGLPYTKYADSLKANLLFVNLIGRELSTKLLRNSKNSVITALHSGEEKLCSYILLTEQDSIFSDTLTDVSRSIGVSYRHTLRILRKLCSEGLMLKEFDNYRIVGRTELIKRAQDFYML